MRRTLRRITNAAFFAAIAAVPIAAILYDRADHYSDPLLYKLMAMVAVLNVALPMAIRKTIRLTLYALERALLGAAAGAGFWLQLTDSGLYWRLVAVAIPALLAVLLGSWAVSRFRSRRAAQRRTGPP